MQVSDVIVTLLRTKITNSAAGGGGERLQGYLCVRMDEDD